MMSERENIANKREQKNEYSIYEYFREHPSVMISVMSAVIMMITFVINYAMYIKNSRYLAYWGVDTVSVSINNINFVYTFFGAMVYYAIILLIQPFLISSYEQYIKEMKNSYYSYYFCKYIQKITGRNKKIIYKHKKAVSNSQKRVDKIEQYIRETQSGIERIKKQEKIYTRKIKLKINVSVIIAFAGIYIATFFLILSAINITN